MMYIPDSTPVRVCLGFGVALVLITAIPALDIQTRLLLAGAGTVFMLLGVWLDFIEYRTACTRIDSLKAMYDTLRQEPDQPNLIGSRKIILDNAKDFITIAEAKMSHWEWQYAQHTANLGISAIAKYRELQAA